MQKLILKTQQGIAISALFTYGLFEYNDFADVAVEYNWMEDNSRQNAIDIYRSLLNRNDLNPKLIEIISDDLYSKRCKISNLFCNTGFGLYKLSFDQEQILALPGEELIIQDLTYEY